MRSEHCSFDLPAADGRSESLRLAYTVHRPDTDMEPRVVAVALPGGGYNRSYFDLQIDGHPGYSQAEYHTARGWVFIACDAAGTGDSSAPAQPQSIAQVAAVHAGLVRELRRRLGEGTLVAGLPPTGAAAVIGLGQSMGGCFTVATQGAHACFDAIGVLGYSALHTELPLPDASTIEIPDDAAEQSQEQLAATMMASFRWAFHWEDVPAAIASADLATVPLRAGEDVVSWGRQATPLPCGADMLTAGVVAAEAAAITVPVLIAQGVRDVVPRPREEPVAYASADDITVYVAPTMAHMHNFASTRRQFWARIHSWADAL
jgi:pimeloyl-ACP methyl ester carboxylesterase